MRIVTTREVFDDVCTEGSLTVNGEFECYTLEPVDRKLEDNPGAKIFGETAIPRGVYKLIVDWSDHFQRRLPHILGVPGFEGVRIHAGNWAKNTEGCTLTGQTRGKDFIGSSVAAFNPLFAKIVAALQDGEAITYEVK